MSGDSRRSAFARGLRRTSTGAIGSRLGEFNHVKHEIRGLDSRDGRETRDTRDIRDSRDRSDGRDGSDGSDSESGIEERPGEDACGTYLFS